MTGSRQRFNLIDRFVRRLRVRKITSLVPLGSKVLDVGCGQENWFIRTATDASSGSLGIDPHLIDEFVDVQGARSTIEEIAEQSPGSFDVSTSLAVIEHIPVDAVTGHLTAIWSVIRPGGRLILTTPTKRSQPILELLAYRLHVISEEEIRDHQHYYGRPEIERALSGVGFADIDHTTFQFGLNQRVIARRPLTA